jgi:hypothetical protein
MSSPPLPEAAAVSPRLTTNSCLLFSLNLRAEDTVRVYRLMVNSSSVGGTVLGVLTQRRVCRDVQYAGSLLLSVALSQRWSPSHVSGGLVNQALACSLMVEMRCLGEASVAVHFPVESALLLYAVVCLQTLACEVILPH